jgi:phage shock protein B
MWILIPLTALAIPIVAIIGTFAYKIAKLYRTTPSPGDDQAAGEMVAAMERMEARIAALETILDAEAPKWRQRA